MNVTPYRVSTITTNGSVGAEVTVAAVFKGVPILSPDSTDDGFLFAEMMVAKGAIFQRGKNPRDATRRRTSQRKKVVVGAANTVATRATQVTGTNVGTNVGTNEGGAADVSRFINQTTVVYRCAIPSSPSSRAVVMTPNIKIFANGNLHMTGIKDVAQGAVIVDRIIKAVNAIPGAKRFADATLKNQDYVVRMINVDFKLDGWGIKRDVLFSLLDETTNLKLVYEANTYQALKVHYYFNAYKNVQNGCCECHAATDPTRKCEGKGKGVVINDCKRVTLTIFGTGKMMIIGASSMAQVDHVHAFAKRMLEEHFEAVRVAVRA